MKTRLKDLTGQTFEKLYVVSRADNKGTTAYWNCRCECGVVKQVRGSKLRNGNTKSCGSCLRKGKPVLARRKEKAALQTAYKRCQQSADKRNIPFELTQEEAEHLFLLDCQYCGAKPSKTIKLYRVDETGDTQFNGIDRINSKIGYTVNNTVSCCPKCNYAKHVMNLDEFRKWVISVYNHLNIGNSWADKS